MFQYLGFIGGFITVSAFVPQVIRTWRTRHTRDLSMSMVALLITSGTLWICYGIYIGDWSLIVTNIGMVTLNAAILTAKLRFG